MPLFSVIIPTYNRRELLGQTLGSVWAQTFTDYEVIVVDDGSTDGTWEELQVLGSRVRALRQPNAGPGAARNLGVQRATGDYLAFLDSDDLWFPWTLATYHQVISRYHAPSVMCASVAEFRGPVPKLVFEALKVAAYRNYLSSTTDPCFAGSGMLNVKRTIFEKLGGFDESFAVAEDHDFMLRAGMEPGFIKIISPKILAYRRHPHSATDSTLAATAAALDLLRRDRVGVYPGKRLGSKHRWKLLTGMLRPVAIACLNRGHISEAWMLYFKSLRMHLHLARFRFVLGFPLLLVAKKASGLRRIKRTPNP